MAKCRARSSQCPLGAPSPEDARKPTRTPRGGAIRVPTVLQGPLPLKAALPGPCWACTVRCSM